MHRKLRTTTSTNPAPTIASVIHVHTRATILTLSAQLSRLSVTAAPAMPTTERSESQAPHRRQLTHVPPAPLARPTQSGRASDDATNARARPTSDTSE